MAEVEIDYTVEEAAIDVTDMSFDDELVDVGAEQELDEELSMERELFAIAHEQNARAEARFAAAAGEPGADEPEADEPDGDEPEPDAPAADEPAADEPDGDETAADEPEPAAPAAEKPAVDEPASDGSGSGAETDE